MGHTITSKIWPREDLIGYRSEHIFLLTPIQDAELIARCLQRGETLCRALSAMFSGFPSQREPRYPLRIYLYESRDEYYRFGEHIRSRGKEDRHTLTAGKFYSNDEISRFFIPDGMEPEGRMLEVLTHELTHHWIFTCCPAFTTADAARALSKGTAELPGHWIVEGFARFVEGFAFDDEAGTFESCHPRVDCLDTLANATSDQLVDWSRLLSGSSQDFGRLATESAHRVPVSWEKGRLRVLSDLNMYYAQAGALCHSLYDDPRRPELRKALLDYLVARYLGKAEALDVEQAFGMTATELGAQAKTFARRSINGPALEGR